MDLWQIAVVLIIAMSFITFIFYAVDKAKAKAGAWRIPEKVLLTSSFLFGAIGGYTAMLLLRHKTKHWYFHAINVISIILHAVLVVYLTGV